MCKRILSLEPPRAQGLSPLASCPAFRIDILRRGREVHRDALTSRAFELFDQELLQGHILSCCLGTRCLCARRVRQLVLSGRASRIGVSLTPAWGLNYNRALRSMHVVSSVATVCLYSQRVVTACGRKLLGASRDLKQHTRKELSRRLCCAGSPLTERDLTSGLLPDDLHYTVPLSPFEKEGRILDRLCSTERTELAPFGIECRNRTLPLKLTVCTGT